jgi:hypothetical protein
MNGALICKKINSSGYKIAVLLNLRKKSNRLKAIAIGQM